MVVQVRVRAGTYYVLVSQSWNCDRYPAVLAEGDGALSVAG